MRAKVKITIIDTGQEYLLLVAKMNVKGILVHTSQTIEPNTQLMLELKLNDQSSILLKGYVHKISDDSTSKKGMVIAFSNPNEEALRKIQRFIYDSKEISMNIEPSPPSKEKKKSRWSLRKKEKEEEPERKTAPKQKLDDQNKTMIVGESDMPSLALSSPDNKSKISYATMDEESLHANNPGMSGKTQHAMIGTKDIGKKKTEKKKPFRASLVYRAFGFVVLIIVGVLAAGPVLKFMDKRFGKKNAVPQPTTTTQTPSSTTTAASPTESASSLETVQVDDQGSFLKISLLGSGNFANNKISKVGSTIHIQLLEIGGFKTKPSTPVSNNPLTKINVSQDGSTTVVDLVCVGKETPAFEAKVYPNGMDIFIYR